MGGLINWLVGIKTVKDAEMCIDCYVDATMSNYIGDGGDASNAETFFGKYGKRWLDKYNASQKTDND